MTQNALRTFTKRADQELNPCYLTSTSTIRYSPQPEIHRCSLAVAVPSEIGLVVQQLRRIDLNSFWHKNLSTVNTLFRCLEPPMVFSQLTYLPSESVPTMASRNNWRGLKNFCMTSFINVAVPWPVPTIRLRAFCNSISFHKLIYSLEGWRHI